MPRQKKNSPETLYINSGNNQLYVKVWQVNKNSPTIIFLHSLSFYSFEYDKLALRLTRAGFNCVAFDFSCHGRSEGERGYWTLTQFVLDTKSVIEYVQSRFNNGIGIFGNSLGAIAGVYTAAQNTKVKSLAVAGCPTIPADFLLTPPNKFLVTIFNILSYIISFTISVKYFIPYHKLFSNLQLIKKMKKDPLIEQSRRISPYSYNKAAHWDARESARRIDTPLLVLHGEKDRIIPSEQSEILYNEANTAEEFKFINTGHMPTLENPDLLGRALREWFTRTLKI